MGELTIKINNESPNANLTMEDNGLIKQKSVNIDDLVAVLASNYKVSTGIVPVGTRFFSGSALQYSILVELPAKIRDMAISRLNSDGSKTIKEVIKIAYPTLLFYFSIKNREANKVRIYSLKHPIQSEKDTLYMFPFSNVYHGDAKICWGGVLLPQVKTPLGIVDIINLFLSSNFNGDLSGRNVMPTKDGNINEYSDFWSVIAYLKDKTDFPNEILKTTNINVGTLMKEI